MDLSIPIILVIAVVGVVGAIVIAAAVVLFMVLRKSKSKLPDGK